LGSRGGFETTSNVLSGRVIGRIGNFLMVDETLIAAHQGSAASQSGAIGKRHLGLANLTRLAYGGGARSRPSKIENELTSKAAING
jgi:hypothetical protein